MIVFVYQSPYVLWIFMKLITDVSIFHMWGNTSIVQKWAFRVLSCICYDNTGCYSCQARHIVPRSEDPKIEIRGRQELKRDVFKPTLTTNTMTSKTMYYQFNICQDLHGVECGDMEYHSRNNCLWSLQPHSYHRGLFIAVQIVHKKTSRHNYFPSKCIVTQIFLWNGSTAILISSKCCMDHYEEILMAVTLYLHRVFIIMTEKILVKRALGRLLESAHSWLYINCTSMLSRRPHQRWQ